MTDGPAAVSPDEVRHVARLARLALTDDEALALAADLEAILGFVGQIQAFEADVPEPSETVRLRPDAPVPSDPEPLLALAPSLDGRLFAVDRVLPPS